MHIVHVFPRQKTIGISSAPLTYYSHKPVYAGGLVLVPIRKKNIPAVVVRSEKLSDSKLALKQSGYSLRSIREIISPNAIIPASTIQLLEWIQSYYLGPASNCISHVFPSLLDTQSARKQLESLPDLVPAKNSKNPAVRFVPAGQSEKIKSQIKKTIKKNGQVLIVYPQRVQVDATLSAWKKITKKTYKYHSDLSVKDRRAAWIAARAGKPGIFSTSRAGVFLPFGKLSLVVVLYESDQAHKVFDSYPRYHSRNVAGKLAQLNGASTIVSDAMPSLETIHAIRRGSIQGAIKISLPVAPNILDIKQAWELGSTDLLLPKVQDTIEKSSHSAVIVGRKGYATYIQCRDCLHRVSCSRCNRALVMSKSKPSLQCGLCSYVQSIPEACPKCSSHKLKTGGLGDEKIVEYLKEEFPKKKVMHLHSEMGSQEDRRKLSEQFYSKKDTVLVGTPYISSLITTRIEYVVVLGNDSLLFIPEFNAIEQFLRSVVNISYRTTRLDIQTFNPTHEAYSFFKHPNKIIESLLTERKTFGYPPYEQLVLVSSASRNAKQNITQLSMYFKKRIAVLINKGILFTDAQIGMMEPYRVYTNGRNEWRILLKVNRSKLKARNLLLQGLAPEFRVDVDPIRLFS